MTSEHKRLLMILAGCPEGATTYNLTTRMEIRQKVINQLARLHLVTIYDASVWPNGRPPRIQIDRVRITQAGKLALITMQRNGL
jgi:hypothetical protein